MTSPADDDPPPLAPDLDDLLGFVPDDTPEPAPEWCRMMRLGRPCRARPGLFRWCRAPSHLSCWNRRPRPPQDASRARPEPLSSAPDGAPTMPARKPFTMVPAEPATGFVLREDAEKLFARRVWALNLVLDQLEEDGVAVIAEAAAKGEDAVKAAFLSFSEHLLERMQEAATIPPEDLAAAIERARPIADARFPRKE